MAGFLDFLTEKMGDFDPGGQWRYGMSTAEKARRTGEGVVPGQPKIDESDPNSAENADRFSAGYYFTKHNPNLGPLAQPLIDALHTAPMDIPFRGVGRNQVNPFYDENRSDPASLQSFADQGMNKAKMENEAAGKGRGFIRDLLGF